MSRQKESVFTIKRVLTNCSVTFGNDETALTFVTRWLGINRGKNDFTFQTYTFVL